MKHNEAAPLLPLAVIARVHNDFPTKFGLPRQSGMIAALESTIVFEPAYRNPDALRGLEGFSHIWLVWGFSQSQREQWSPMVRPPRLGGNRRMGVFATRSPNRPNPLGLSSVKLIALQTDAVLGTVLRVSGADMMDGTPIFDIKPYLPYADCHPEATGGFAENTAANRLAVTIAPKWLALFSGEQQETLTQVLAGDPRPAYQDDPTRVYGFNFAGYDVRFTVVDGMLSVCEVVRLIGE